MKKVIVALALFLSVQFAFAQKSHEQAAAAVKSAEEATTNPKKAAKTATWLKLAKAYIDAYEAPQGSLMLNISRTELSLLLGNQKPLSTETVVLEGNQCKKEIYEDKDLYFNQNDILFMIDVKKYPCENALDKAVEAYKKAYEVDVNHKKNKDIIKGLDVIAGKYMTEGMNKYTLGDYAAASKMFAASAAAAGTEPNTRIDTTMIYNAGFTAWMSKNFEDAQKCFEKCLELEYYYEDGEVYAKLADVYKQLGNVDASRNTLEDGFVKFPQSQSILIGLINYYLECKDSDTSRLFELLDVAKKNEPNNASLFYVEGNIRSELGMFDEAIAAYAKCAEINSEYEFGYIGAGILYYNKALELQEKAQNELDDAKYMKLLEEFDACLLKAVDPFEKAFEVSKDEAIKKNVAEYLKNIYYRFITKGDEYKAKYDKYDAIVKGE